MAVAVVIGANRGIGLGLVQVLRAQGETVIATARNPDPSDALHACGASVLALDMDDPAAVDGLAALIHGPVDLLIVNAGVSGPRSQGAHMTSLADTGALFYTNAVAPLRIARVLARQLVDGAVVGFMSSVLGSIATHAQGGMELYGASKAALNRLAADYAAEVSPRNIAVLSLHPGWVKTDMGGANAPTTVAASTEGLVRVLTEARGQPGHRYVDYTGKALPW